jgi:anthranilate phosphoribosyltransferase
MRECLTGLFQGSRLTQSQADAAMQEITSGQCSDAEAIAFMVAMNMRKLSVSELDGFRISLMRQATKVDLASQTLVDMCGTGGDGKDSFNISTTAALVVAACGVPVAKHGNHGASSLCGSSTVLEALDVPLPLDSSAAKRCFSDCGIVFLHAPYFHPALKRVAPLRQALGCRTFFNLLGPLLNPASPSHQVTGVYNREVQRLYSHIFERGHWKDFALVNSNDGYDELTYTDDANVITRSGNQEIKRLQISSEDIVGGKTIEQSKAIVENVLAGKGSSAQEQVVAGNAALALTITGKGSFTDCVEMARECLNEGRALKILDVLREWKGSNSRGEGEGGK